PAKRSAAGCLLLAGLVILLGWAGRLNPALTGLGAVTFSGLAVLCAASVWRGRRAVRAAIAAEARRGGAARAAQQRDLFAAQEEHARRFRAWQGRQRAFSGQALWYPVSLPAETDRVDLVGGTMAGWSALLTTLAVPRLAAGDEVTVVDLSAGAVARGLAGGRVGPRPGGAGRTAAGRPARLGAARRPAAVRPRRRPARRGHGRHPGRLWAGRPYRRRGPRSGARPRAPEQAAGGARRRG